MRRRAVIRKLGFVEPYIGAVCETFGVTRSVLLGNKRPGMAVEARHALFWLLRKRTRLSYPDIGRALGGKHHTTVLYGCQRMAKRIRSDEGIRGFMGLAERRLDAVRAGLPRGI